MKKRAMQKLNPKFLMQGIRDVLETKRRYGLYATSTLPELLDLEGEAFVRAAYYTVLRRRVDPTGLACYTPKATSRLARLYLVLRLYCSWERGLIRSGLCASLRRLGTTLSHRLRPPHRGSIPENFYYEFENCYRYDFDTILAQLEKRYASKAESARALGKQALDLGCGRGEGVAFLNAVGFQAIGVDSNRTAVEYARQQGLDVRHDDLFRYLRHTPNASLAALTAFHVIEHLSFKQLWKLVEEARRTLMPGGFLLLETPNTRNLLVSSGDFYRDPTHCSHIFPDTLQFLMNYSGFDGTVCFFSEDQRPVPYQDFKFQNFDEYLHVSRDMAWMGNKR